MKQNDISLQQRKSSIFENTPQIMKELSDIDKGDDIQRRFRYQHTATAYFALLMYLKKIQYKELICEHHEDILGVLNDGRYDGIQIKTQKPELGLFSLSTASIKKSLHRFINLDKKYPNIFSGFIFAANGSFLQDDTGNSIETLKKQLSIEAITPGYIFKPNTLEAHIKNLIDKTGNTREQVIKTLHKVKFQPLPSMNDIDSKIITETLSDIHECDKLTMDRLKQILNNLITIVYQKSSKKLSSPIDDYISLLSGDAIENASQALINEKRITHDIIKDILSNILIPDYYLGVADENAMMLRANRQQIMKYKMNCGKIDPSIIYLMDDLRDKSEQYYLQGHHKGQVSVEEYTHIQTIVWNESIEAELNVKKSDKPYGEDMLIEIEKRLKQIILTRSEDVAQCPYEILKGQVGSLAGDCRVKFSPIPKKGWGHE